MTTTTAREYPQPRWLWDLLGQSPDADSFRLNGTEFRVVNGIPRSAELLSDTQAHTEETFGFKWKKRDTFDSPASLERMKGWLIERYGDVVREPWFGDGAILLDAGCGAGMSGLELFEGGLDKVRYLGVDVSEAVDVAAERFAERGAPGAFMQADLSTLPLPEGSVDLIFSEGVLHHTDSTERALGHLATLLKPGGRILFYVYKKKGPIREFTDDYLRDRLRGEDPQVAWDLLRPLTQLGVTLGELDIKITVPEAIDVLEIPAGEYDLQRFFYWHVAKMFYHPTHSFEELNHINFDWYTPANAARQSPEEVRAWCDAFGLEIEREVVEDAGITVIARRREG